MGLCVNPELSLDAGCALAPRPVRPPEFGISEKRTKRERINVQQINEWKVHKKPAHGKMKNG